MTDLEEGLTTGEVTSGDDRVPLLRHDATSLGCGPV